ncbi:uncharacterized protein AC631_04429 [Debaryomyces fabryi]|uniref:ER transporter 6TM N-terminal domain-containing protein n=1 Tax=Debaryomyces fabryi TaxID=58627 RepID=A0A0V1PU75_9ASCO|nr:uncharacterized protein AC631_04429 [Debaryomyces fabryi]KRZ99804.1 hypothetical protein AC631_04429 [Debaryomyces fabryi]CUM49286.1 unnamed protein product [Debaryomyces fabryi]
MARTIYSSDESITDASAIDPVAYVEPQSTRSTQNNEINTINEPANIYDDKDKKPPIESEPPKKKQALWKKLFNMVRPGYFLDHLDYESFKVVLRTWVQIWVTVVLMVIPRVGNWMGNASYLMQIVGFIIVAGGTLIVFNASFTIICFFYVMVSWLFATIALLISNRLRGSITPEDLAKLLIQDGSCTAENILTCMISQIFTGRFLTTRCTVVFIICLMIGLTMYGMSLRLHPLLRPGFVAGIISLIILTNYYVFFPVFMPKVIGYSIIKPMGVAFVTKIVTSILIFPTTSSFLYFNGSSKILNGLSKATKNNINFLKTLKPSGPDFMHFKKYSAAITGFRNNISQLEIVASSIKYEVSFGRLDAGDAGEFRYLLKNLINLSAGYEFFYQLLSERLDIVSDNIRGLGRRASTSSTYNPKNTTGHSKLFTALQQSYKSVGEYENSRRIKLLRNRIYSTDASDSLTLQDLDNVSRFITTYFTSILEAVDFGIENVTKWLTAANKFRTYTIIIPGSKEKHKQMQQECRKGLLEAKRRLKNELERWSDHKHIENLMQGTTRNEEALLCLISQASLFLNLAKDQSKAIMRMIDLFLSIDENRPTPSFITPFTHSVRDSARYINSSVGAPEENRSSFWQEEVSARDADALPPSHLYHFLGIKCVSFYEILLNKHLWFWIRASGLVTVCCIPFYCRTTAEWYYNNRLTWIPVVCCLTVSEYVGEAIYGILSRFFYGFAAGVIGMVAWYISAGSGTGNYYGYCVVTGILYFYLCFFRHFSIHLNPVPQVLLCVTVALIMGTSWIDANYAQSSGYIGYGFTAAWKRHLSVTIAISISFLASCFPRVSTSKVVIRKVLAQAIEQIGVIHCNVSRFGLGRLQNPNIHILRRHDATLEKFRTVLLKLASITRIMGPLQYEIPISGNWPASKYARLQSSVTDVVQLYVMLLSLFDQLEEPEFWVPIIMGRMGWTCASMNANFFSMVHMGAGSLKSKTALPKITQANLSIQHLDLLRSKWGLEKISLSERFYNQEKDTEKEYRVDEGESLHDSMVKNLDYEKLFSADGQCNIVALLLAHMIYRRLDETIIIIKSLVGEKFDFDYSIFEDEYENEYWNYE